jgi:hypothetical protein
MRCQYYRIGVTTLGSKNGPWDLSSLHHPVNRKEWCEHPRSKHDWTFGKVPCSGELEKCPLSPQEWQLTQIYPLW